jgi:thioredoxin-like negative regulator of GroEL
LTQKELQAQLCKRLGTTIVPTVYVFRDRKPAESFPNLMRIDDLP